MNCFDCCCLTIRLASCQKCFEESKVWSQIPANNLYQLGCLPKVKRHNFNGSYILIIVFSAPDQEEDEQAEDEDHKAEEDARYGAHHHVAGAGVSGLVRGAVALGVAFVPVTPVCSTTLEKNS